MSTKNISATLDPGLLKRLDKVAQATERNRSWLISKAIESYLEELEDAQIATERLHDKRLTPAQVRKALGVRVSG